jgi:hypothetical protein
MTMLRIGMMHHSNIVHIARHVKTASDGYKLYAPVCSSMQRANVAYLGTQLGFIEAVTCKRCQKKAAQYPGRFDTE